MRSGHFDRHFEYLGSLKAMKCLNFDTNVSIHSQNIQSGTNFIVIRALEVIL